MSRPRGAAAARGGGPGGGAGAPDRAVPVLVARVERRDVPVYLRGLGTVTAFYTATVRARVDGLLERVLFREGQSVRRGEPLAQIDPRPFAIALAQAQAALVRDQAQLAAARNALARNEALRTRNFVAPQDIDNQRATVGQLEGAVLIDRAQIATARLNLQFARVTSPIDGVTGVRLIDPGNLVHATDATGLVVVTQLDPITVLFTLPQDELSRVASAVARGGPPLAVDVASRDGAARLGRGQLAVIDNEAVAQTGTIQLKAVVPNPARALWPGQFVSVRLELEVERGALVVPGAAVQRGPQGPFVYVVGPDGRAQSRPVTVARLEGESAVLARGVSAGETVVTDGQNQLRPGARVLVRGAPPRARSAAGDGRDGDGDGQNDGDGDGQNDGDGTTDGARAPERRAP